MKTSSLLIALIFIAAPCFSQNIQNMSADHSVTIAEINGEAISLDEIISSYNRNNDAEQISVDELVDFLPSYIEYRMKLKEGYYLQYQNDPDITEEFEFYGRESAYSYWIENDVKQSIIQAFQEKSKSELKAFHILAEIAENATESYRDSVYQIMLEARKLLLDGADPEKINNQYSSRRNGNSMGGQLPWITAGRTVKDFEDALYDLEMGEISMPVRTQFGYHIIILQEKRDRQPDRKVSHIFLQHGENDDGKQKIEHAFTNLQQGEDWNETVQKFSQDGGTINRNGEIGWIGYAMQYPEEFVDIVMAADPDLPFSEPIEMSYGYHIIRIDSVRTYTSDEQRNNEILNQLQQLQRLNPDRDDVYKSVSRAGGMNIFEQNVEKILTDNSLSTNTSEDSDLILMEFNDKTYTGIDFSNYLEKNEFDPNQSNTEIFDKFKKEIIRADLINITKNNFPEFKKEINNFKEGLIVFKVNEDNVWNHETMDREVLKQYFDENRESYIYDRQFVFYRVSSADEELVEDARRNVLDGIHPSDLPMLFNDLSILHDSTRNQQSTHYPHIEALNPKETSEIIERGSLRTFYYLDDIEESRPMTFDEAFYRVASDYQPIREEQFLNQLIEKYQVVLYPENIR